MKADLCDSWILLAIAPFGVSGEQRNKYVSCLLGDELADDDEFWKLCESQFVVDGYSIGSECKHCYRGSCFHPFRPGQLAMAIFADCFGSQPNAKEITPEKEKEFLGNRRCRGCAIRVTEKLHDTAFYGVRKFYEEMLERVTKHRTLYGIKYEKFRSDYGRGINGIKYFSMGDPINGYEDNVSGHFEKMMQHHYESLERAILRDTGKLKDKELNDAIQRVIYDLVTHFSWYWEAGKYKEKDYVR